MPESLLIRVRVQPGARRSEVAGIIDGRLRIRTTAPPTEGRANKDVAIQLAKAFGVPVSRISLESGAKGRLKTFSVRDPAIEPDWLADIHFR